MGDLSRDFPWKILVKALKIKEILWLFQDFSRIPARPADKHLFWRFEEHCVISPIFGEIIHQGETASVTGLRRWLCRLL